MDVLNKHKRINVAVGVVIDSHGKILVAKRLPHQHQGECWEFPGGKIEANESVHDALKRELCEEVGLNVIRSEPWLEVSHDYTDKAVCLMVHKVTEFSGIAIGREGQEIGWIEAKELTSLPWPKANEAIVKALVEVK